MRSGWVGGGGSQMKRGGSMKRGGQDLLLWHFCSKKNTRKLEMILKRALRSTFDDTASDYCVLLEKANSMCSLELGRLRRVAIETSK